MAIDGDKLNEFLGRALVDFGATFHAALVRIGDKLGLYKALAAGGPQMSAELAKRTGTTERYIREWLSAQAAGGYVSYDSTTGQFYLTEEQAFAMADETSPGVHAGCLPGGTRCRKSRGATGRTLPIRCRIRLARTSSGAFCRNGKIFSPRLCGKSDCGMDSGARRR